MPSIGLCVMSKDYDENIRRFIKDYSKYLI